MSASDYSSRTARAEAAAKLQAFTHKIFYRPLPQTKEVEITLVVNQKWGPIAVEVLRFMEQMVGTVARSTEAGYREMRVSDILAETEAKYRLIRQRYHDLRAEGLKHRAAVRNLLNDQRLPFYGRWKYGDYNWCVKIVLPGLKKV